MIIAIMGNDGSGKTTIAKEINRFFKSLGFGTYYKHEYEYAILRFLFKLIGKKKIEKLRREMIVEKKNSLKYYFWPFLVWLDVLFQYVYFKLLRRKTIIILDRYPYDHYLSFKYLKYLTKFTEWLYLCFPKPDIGIVLTVKPEIAYERKKDTHNYPLEFYKRQTREYLSLARKLQLPIVNTNEPLKRTLERVILLLFQNPNASKKILHKGVQNRIIFYVLKKYGILKNKQLQIFWKEYEKRRKMFRESIKVLKKLLKKSGVQSYALIKTLDDFEFVGNDIDILVSPSDFERIFRNILRNGERYGIEKINHSRRLDKGKMDIFIKNGLKLDIHSYIGWRNVVFLDYNQVLRKKFIPKNTLFGVKCNTVKDEINSIIIIITHVFEKGFITLDEYKFLKNNLNESFIQTNFPTLLTILSDYILWISKTLREKKECSYPLFVPMHIIIKCYSKLLLYSKSKHENVLWKLKALVRDIPLIAFWRIRYFVKNKMPFGVDINYE